MKSKRVLKTKTGTKSTNLDSRIDNPNNINHDRKPNSDINSYNDSSSESETDHDITNNDKQTMRNRKN